MSLHYLAKLKGRFFVEILMLESNCNLSIPLPFHPRSGTLLTNVRMKFSSTLAAL